MKYEYKKIKVSCKTKDCKFTEKTVECDDDNMYKKCPYCKKDLVKENA